MTTRDLRENEASRRLRGALRTAFDRAHDLQPPRDLADRLREQLREAAEPQRGSAKFPSRWLALAAGLVLAAGLGVVMFWKTPMAPAEALARDAIGDHRHCALRYREIRTPMPLDEAARRFDDAYRLLVDGPPDDIPTPDGTAHVIDRHSCVYGARRFGHVVLQYRDRVVSLLVTASDRATGADAIPHVIGHPTDGLSVVSLNASRHAIVLVADLESHELTQLSNILSVPLMQRLGRLIPDSDTPTDWFVARPVREWARAFDERLVTR